MQRVVRIMCSSILVIAAVRPLVLSVIAQSDAPGAVYTMTNTVLNAVVVYSRSAAGTLTPAGQFATGGSGTGSGLGNQNGVVLTRNNRWLLVVNAGSNQVSVFDVLSNGLELGDVVASGGNMPISVTAHGKLVYVLN